MFRCFAPSCINLAILAYQTKVLYEGNHAIRTCVLPPFYNAERPHFPRLSLTINLTLGSMSTLHCVMEGACFTTIDEHRGTFRCWSWTLTVLADSGPLHGLSLIDLGSLSDFHDLRTPGCVYVSVINNRSFGRIWLVSWTITHHFGSQSDFHGCRTPRCAYVLVVKTCSLGRFWPVWWTITHWFGVPKWFPWLANLEVRLCIVHQ